MVCTGCVSAYVSTPTMCLKNIKCVREKNVEVNFGCWVFCTNSFVGPGRKQATFNWLPRRLVCVCSSLDWARPDMTARAQECPSTWWYQCNNPTPTFRPRWTVSTRPPPQPVVSSIPRKPLLSVARDTYSGVSVNTWRIQCTPVTPWLNFISLWVGRQGRRRGRKGERKGSC